MEFSRPEGAYNPIHPDSGQCTGTLSSSIQWDASGHTSLCESNIGNVKINPFLMIMRKEFFQTSKPKINFWWTKKIKIWLRGFVDLLYPPPLLRAKFQTRAFAEEFLQRVVLSSNLLKLYFSSKVWDLASVNLGLQIRVPGDCLSNC